MSKYDNTNSGVLFPNRNPKKDTSPHFTGSLNIEGNEYYASAWRRKELSDDFETEETFLDIKLSYKDWQNMPNLLSKGKLKKEPNKFGKQPDCKGFIQIEDITYDLAAWNRESPKFPHFFSLAVTPQGKHKTTVDIDETVDDFDTEMPF